MGKQREGKEHLGKRAAGRRGLDGSNYERIVNCKKM